MKRISAHRANYFLGALAVSLFLLASHSHACALWDQGCTDDDFHGVFIQEKPSGWAATPDIPSIAGPIDDPADASATIDLASLDETYT